jgi:F0F1-type ATP synthase membrane subunit a
METRDRNMSVNVQAYFENVIITLLMVIIFFILILAFLYVIYAKKEAASTPGQKQKT